MIKEVWAPSWPHTLIGLSGRLSAPLLRELQWVPGWVTGWADNILPVAPLTSAHPPHDRNFTPWFDMTWRFFSVNTPGSPSPHWGWPGTLVWSQCSDRRGPS